MLLDPLQFPSSRKPNLTAFEVYIKLPSCYYQPHDYQVPKSKSYFNARNVFKTRHISLILSFFYYYDTVIYAIIYAVVARNRISYKTQTRPYWCSPQYFNFPNAAT